MYPSYRQLGWAKKNVVNPFTDSACKISRLKSAHIHPCKQYQLFDGPIKNLLSILRVLIEILSRALAKGNKGLHDFKFETFIGRFKSDLLDWA